MADGKQRDQVTEDTQAREQEKPTTPETPEAKTPPTGEEHVEDPKASTKDKGEDIITKYERVTKKVGAMESELSQLRGQRQTFESLASWAMQDKDRFREAVKATRGFDDAQADQAIDNLQKEYPDLWKDGGKQATVQEREATKESLVPRPRAKTSVTTPPVGDRQDVAREVEEHLALRKFWAAYPEYSQDAFAKLPYEDREEAQVKLHKIFAEASGTTVSRGYDFGTALIKAAEAITGKAPKDKAQEELSEQAQRNVVAGSSATSSTAGQSTQKGGVILTDEQREMARASGMTDEEYAKNIQPEDR